MAERLCKTVAELEEMPMSELTEWKALFLLRAQESEQRERDAFIARAVQETGS